MKNVIPLITAVLLGLAAVFAVSKTMKKTEKPEERTRNVLIVTAEIAQGELIQESRIAVKAIPESAAPKNCIDEANMSFTFNQRAKRRMQCGKDNAASGRPVKRKQGHTFSCGKAQKDPKRQMPVHSQARPSQSRCRDHRQAERARDSASTAEPNIPARNQAPTRGHDGNRSEESAAWKNR